MKEKPSWGIHWFRRDLRLPNNRGLLANLKRTHGRTVGLFCFDSKFLSRPDFSHRRFAFFIDTLKDLRSEMKRHGGELLVLDMQPKLAFAHLIKSSEKQGLPLVTFCRDYEPFARDRDQAVTEELKKLGVDVRSERDHLLFEPHTILKDDGSAYQKYSAFSRAWMKKLESIEGQKRIARQKQSADYLNRAKARSTFKLSWKEVLDGESKKYEDQLDHFDRENRKHFDGETPAAGIRAAYQQLEEFRPRLKDYLEDRSIPATSGSSEFSKFLKNGSLTLPQVVYEYKLAHEKTDNYESSRAKFLKELIWREYYYYILFHSPRVEHEAFDKKFAKLDWNTSRADFEKWKEGRTGVPIVDAGMRELNETGWINNRVRIIVATYLTKDLRINWQWGEEYFMNQLIDGDLAANNGNWQWVASTGSENQPYFRVMNVWRQSERFDPNGEYIRKWIPELEGCETKALHDEEADRSGFKYPPPLTNHKQAREEAIAIFKRARR